MRLVFSKHKAVYASVLSIDGQSPFLEGECSETLGQYPGPFGNPRSFSSPEALSRGAPSRSDIHEWHRAPSKRSGRTGSASAGGDEPSGGGLWSRRNLTYGRLSRFGAHGGGTEVPARAARTSVRTPGSAPRPQALSVLSLPASP